MDRRPTYPVHVEREGTLWVASVDGLPARTNHVTDVEHFADLDREVRDFIATVTDCEPGDFALSWHYQQGDREYTPVIEELRQWEAQARQVEENRDRVRVAAARSMKAAGLSLRAIADALDISHGRVGQLLAGR